LNPKLHLCEAFACPNSTDQDLGHSQENIHQSSAHRKVVIFKFVPLWRAQNILGGRSVNNNFVRVSLSLVSAPILKPHQVLSTRDKILPS
jgi:hypothetical protein